MLLFSSFIFSVAVLAFGHFSLFLRMGEFYYYICRLFFYLYLSLIVLHNSFDPKQAKWHAPGSPHVKAPRKLIPFVMSPLPLEPGSSTVQGHRVNARTTVPRRFFGLNQGLPGQGLEDPLLHIRRPCVRCPFSSSLIGKEL